MLSTETLPPAHVQLIAIKLSCGIEVKHFPEVKNQKGFDKLLFQEMLSFAGWNLWGNLAGILFGQGLNMLLNVFFGPIVNAARSISVQVQGAIHQFSTNFQMAINPQITKTYAVGHLEEMHRLVFRSSKYTFYLLFMLCLPIVIEAPIILKVWLKTVPEYTVIFLRIMIVTMIVDSTANPLMVSAAATGNVKKYQSVIGGILLSIVPISYIVLKLGAEPWSVFLVHFCVCCIAYITRLFIIRPLIKLSILAFIKDVILRCFLVAILAIIVPLSAHIILPKTIVSSLIVIFLSVGCAALCSFYLGLDNHERNVIVEKVKSMLVKVVAK